MRRSILNCWQICFAILGFSLVSIYESTTVAQVTSDGTVNTQVNQNGNTAEITGGETRGSNLFHSFQDFSVQTGNEALFDNATDISNIFSRVTGGNISNIDGVIRANGSSNLFLINPAGIVFGAGARLNLGGSFYGSTANSILFEDGEFSATDLENPPLLTVNAPIGLGFRDNPADITVRGDGNGTRLEDSEVVDTQDALRVGENATIGFIGGNLNFESATVKTAGGRIELGSVNGGIVDLVEADNGFTFDYLGIEAFQDISLSGTSSVIDASGNGGGDINIVGRNIFINDSSQVEASTLGNEAGGEINVSATGSLSIGDRAGIFTNTLGLGTGGNITIDAVDEISISNNSNVNVIGSPGGSVDINTKNLSLLSGSRLSAGASPGSEVFDLASGDIVINLSEDLVLDGSTTIINSNFGLGNSGNVEVNARNILFNGGSSITSSVNSQGNSGEININASGDISFDGVDSFDVNGPFVTSGVRSFVGEDATGSNTGDINITAQNLNLTNGASIENAVNGVGNSGNINLDIADTITVNGFGLVQPEEDSSNIPSEIFSNVGSSGIGNSGNIEINTQNLFLAQSGNIDTDIRGQGNAGNIEINANTITLDGTASPTLNAGRISSQAFSDLADNPEAEANAGNLIINTNSLSLANGARIEADSRTTGSGNGGNIQINAEESVSIDGETEEMIVSVYFRF